MVLIQPLQMVIVILRLNKKTLGGLLMEWLKPFEVNNQFLDNTDSFSDFKIREYIPNSNVQKKYSLLTQFFLLLGNSFSNTIFVLSKCIIISSIT